MSRKTSTINSALSASTNPGQKTMLRRRRAASVVKVGPGRRSALPPPVERGRQGTRQQAELVAQVLAHARLLAAELAQHRAQLGLGLAELGELNTQFGQLLVGAASLTLALDQGA